MIEERKKRDLAFKLDTRQVAALTQDQLQTRSFFALCNEESVGETPELEEIFFSCQ